MKRSIIIIFAILLSVSAIGQTDVKTSANQNNNYVALKMFKGDTLGYVQHNFIDNKEKYIGKDLNTLLNDLEIPVKSFMPHITPLNNESIPSIYLQFQSFNDARIRNDSRNKAVNIIIEWFHPVPLDSVLRLSFINKKAWTVEERNFFGRKIIGNILRTIW